MHTTTCLHTSKVLHEPEIKSDLFHPNLRCMLQEQMPRVEQRLLGTSILVRNAGRARWGFVMPMHVSYMPPLARAWVYKLGNDRFIAHGPHMGVEVDA